MAATVHAVLTIALRDLRQRVRDRPAILLAGFSDAVGAGRAAELKVIGDAQATLAVGVARSVLNGFASSVESVQVSIATVLISSGTSPDPALIAGLSRQALALPDPIILADDRTADRVASNMTFYAASMAVLFVFFAAQFGVTSLLAERRAGTPGRRPPA